MGSPDSAVEESGSITDRAEQRGLRKLATEGAAVEEHKTCPGCIDEIQVGFRGQKPATCIYQGTPGGDGEQGDVRFTQAFGMES